MIDWSIVVFGKADWITMLSFPFGGITTLHNIEYINDTVALEPVDYDAFYADFMEEEATNRRFWNGTMDN